MFPRVLSATVVATCAALSVGAATPPMPAVDPAAGCLRGGYVDLFPQDGANPSTTFTKQRDCMTWLRGGGAVGKLKPELVAENGLVHFWLTVAGAAPAGTTAACGAVPLLISYTGDFGDGCLDPPFVPGTPFQVLFVPCSAGDVFETTVAMATASGGVVERTVTAACEP